jgi:tripartite-type tricarboxylate transporter receptor subunit TctC
MLRKPDTGSVAQRRAAKGAMKALGFAFAAMLATSFGAPVFPQPYPNKPVRMLLGPAAGGATDVMARTFASKLSEVWGQQVVIENRPGAGNTIAPTIAAKATPDGYTIVQCGISDAIAPALYKKLSYDQLRDFAPISLIGTTANVLVVHPSVPAKSVQEFIAYARANAGKIDYGSTGVGISTHLSMELFKTMTGVNLVHVPYKAFALALPDLLAGRITVMMNNLPGQVDAIKTGKLRALGVTTLKRSPRFPEIPTIHESGVPGFEVVVWYGVCAPAAVPAPILNKIHADTVKALGAPDLRSRLEQQGIDPAPSPAREQYAAFIKSETTKWAKVVKDANIPAQ